MSKNKLNTSLQDFQEGMKVKLHLDQKQPIMSVHAISGNIVYCDWTNGDGKPERKGFHWKQLEIIESICI